MTTIDVIDDPMRDPAMVKLMVQALKVRMTGDRILVKRDKPEAVTASGLIIPETAQRKATIGTVLAVGPGRALDHMVTEVGWRCRECDRVWMVAARLDSVRDISDKVDMIVAAIEGHRVTWGHKPYALPVLDAVARAPMDVRVGDRVVFDQYVPADITVFGIEGVVIMSQGEVAGVLEDS